MKIVYLEITPYGKFYFNPETLEGVAISSDFSPAMLRMGKDWDSYTIANARDLEISDQEYRKLVKSADRRNSNLVNAIRQALIDEQKA